MYHLLSPLCRKLHLLRAQNKWIHIIILPPLCTFSSPKSHVECSITHFASDSSGQFPQVYLVFICVAAVLVEVKAIILLCTKSQLQC